LRDSSLVAKLVPYLPDTSVAESSLVAACPQRDLSPPVASSVRVFSVGRNWFVLHAAACAGSLVPAEAFAAQIAVDRAPTSLKGIQLLVQRFPDAVITASLRHDERRLLALAGELCAKNPELLRPWDGRRPAWQHLFAETVGISPSTWTTLGPDRVGLRNEFLEDLLSGKGTEAKIWHAISLSRDADLTAIPRRRDVWRLLPEADRPRFLQATVAGWIERFLREPGFETSLEPELAAHILLSDAQPPLLDVRHPQTIAVALAAFTHFPQLTEAQLLTWLRSMEWVCLHVDSGAGGCLGKLVSTRRWSRAAGAICDLAMKTPEWKSAAFECSALVGVLRRFRLQLRFGFDESSSEQFWRALEEEGAKLYPRGPASRELWSRADGNESDLPVRGTGAEQWAAAIRLLRNGGGKKCTAQTLLKVMVNEFGKNDDLRELESFARREKL